MKKKRIKIMLERPGMYDGFNALAEWIDVQFDDGEETTEMMINGKIWNTSEDAYKEMGTTDLEFIGTMFGFVWDLHNEVDWPDVLESVLEDEQHEMYSSYFQSCTSRVRHFYNNASSWMVRETGAPLVAHTPSEQLAGLLEYASLTEDSIKKHIENAIKESQ